MKKSGARDKSNSKMPYIKQIASPFGKDTKKDIKGEGKRIEC